MEDKEYLDNPGEFFGEETEESYTEPEGYADSGAALARVPHMAPVAYGNINSRAMRRLENRVEMEAAKARAAGRLSAELIMNTAALSALGEQAAKTAPGARKAIDHIINMYAASHAQGLAERWALWSR